LVLWLGGVRHGEHGEGKSKSLPAPVPAARELFNNPSHLQTKPAPLPWTGQTWHQRCLQIRSGGEGVLSKRAQGGEAPDVCKEIRGKVCQQHPSPSATAWLIACKVEESGRGGIPMENRFNQQMTAGRTHVHNASTPGGCSAHPPTVAIASPEQPLASASAMDCASAEPLAALAMASEMATAVAEPALQPVLGAEGVGAAACGCALVGPDAAPRRSAVEQVWTQAFLRGIVWEASMAVP